ncbi:MAG: hypothetical protein AABY07_08160 [Nanoarchaeota archaeon]
MPEYNQEPPTEQVLNMIQQSYSNEEIINALQNQGYSNQSISEALNQAHTKSSVEGIPSPPSPQMQPSILNQEKRFKPDFLQPGPPVRNIPAPPIQESPDQQLSFDRQSADQFQELAESIIDEKWQKLLENVGDLGNWKERVKNDVLSIKQELLRLESRFENLQAAVTGKIRDYDKGIQNVGTDIKALEKLLQNILQPLSTNVKELSKLTTKLKK